MPALRDTWEATGAELEKLQATVGCVTQEANGLRTRTPPSWSLTFAPSSSPVKILPRARVAVIRQEEPDFPLLTAQSWILTTHYLLLVVLTCSSYLHFPTLW